MDEINLIFIFGGLERDAQTLIHIRRVVYVFHFVFYPYRFVFICIAFFPFWMDHVVYHVLSVSSGNLKENKALMKS